MLEALLALCCCIYSITASDVQQVIKQTHIFSKEIFTVHKALYEMYTVVNLNLYSHQGLGQIHLNITSVLEKQCINKQCIHS